MEPPGQTCVRLLAALEVLAAEEQGFARRGEIKETLATQQRAESIIGRLAELLDRPDVAARAAESLLPRIAALRAEREATLDLLEARMDENRTRQGLVQAAGQRLEKMKTAYRPGRDSRRSSGSGFRRSA